jgi:hypothetical protein
VKTTIVPTARNSDCPVLEGFLREVGIEQVAAPGDARLVVHGLLSGT